MNNPNTSETPFLVIVMGVSGCGKTEVAEALASKLSIEFIEADEHHSVEAKALMKGGHPLTDAMRAPWINSICCLIDALTQQNKNVVLACSTLKKHHRDNFRSLGLSCHFIYLEGSEALISDRLHQRVGHFFPPTLLHSQLEALEHPGEEPDVTVIDITASLPEVIKAAMVAAHQFFTSIKS